MSILLDKAYSVCVLSGYMMVNDESSILFFCISLIPVRWLCGHRSAYKPKKHICRFYIGKFLVLGVILFTQLDLSLSSSYTHNITIIKGSSKASSTLWILLVINSDCYTFLSSIRNHIPIFLFLYTFFLNSFGWSIELYGLLGWTHLKQGI